MSEKVMRIAMWAGPRNVSTAMMRSWGNRPDTVVCDEPFYAHYLQVTCKPHPGASEVIETGETDWRRVVATLTQSLPAAGEEGKNASIFYQKHMAHHLLPGIEREWLAGVANCFLIRHPRDVITSYLAKHDRPSVEDLGYVQQVDIFDSLRGHGCGILPVIEAQDVQNQPRKTLGLLCDCLNVPFSDSMLLWPPGPRSTDGIWAKYWYKEVEGSTSFRPYKSKFEPIPGDLAEVYEKSMECYMKLYQHRLL